MFITLGLFFTSGGYCKKFENTKGQFCSLNKEASGYEGSYG